jgi:hypothetical protein
MITLPATGMDTLISYVTGMIQDLMPLILVVLGISIAFLIIDSLINKEDLNKED